MYPRPSEGLLVSTAGTVTLGPPMARMNELNSGNQGQSVNWHQPNPHLLCSSQPQVLFLEHLKSSSKQFHALDTNLEFFRRESKQATFRTRLNCRCDRSTSKRSTPQWLDLHLMGSRSGVSFSWLVNKKKLHQTTTHVCPTFSSQLEFAFWTCLSHWCCGFCDCSTLKSVFHTSRSCGFMEVAVHRSHRTGPHAPQFLTQFTLKWPFGLVSATGTPFSF